MTVTLLCVEADELTKLVITSKPSCLPDPLQQPTNKAVKEILPVLGQLIHKIINTSLSTSCMPKSLKMTVIHGFKNLIENPTIKKIHSFITNLTYFSEIQEKAVVKQVSSYCSSNHILETFPSGFRSNYNTETALFKVVNDLLLLSHYNSVSAQVLPDLQ